MTRQALYTDTNEAHSWEQTISAALDGETELEPGDLDTPYGRQVWDTYHLIGDVLRSDDLAITPSSLFYARLSKQIDSEPSIVAAPLRTRKVVRFGVPGIALALVASLAWLAVPSQNRPESPVTVQLAATEAAPASGVSDFIEAHRELAGSPVLRQVAYNGGVLRQ